MNDGPDQARRDYESAVALHRQGKLAEAERLYRAVGARFPGHPGVLHGLGSICLRTGRIEDAAALLRKAHDAAPADAGILSDYGAACLALGWFQDAVNCFEQILQRTPGHRLALQGIGDAFSILGRDAEAQAAFERLLADDPAHGGAHYGLGMLALQRGRPDDARLAFARAVALEPRRGAYHRALAEVAPFQDGDARLVALVALARDAALPDDQRVELDFALFKACDDLGRYETAFTHLKRGNDRKRRLVTYDEAAVADFFRAIAETFTADAMRRGGSGDPSELPIFVVGMPRSGTTLVEQILASHPDVFGAGELTVISELVAADLSGARFGRAYVERVRRLAPDARRIIDKLPANFRHLGLIHLALPRARVIHVRRDPMDTCFSCYSKLFLNGLNYTYALGELGRYYKRYEALMAHWRDALPAGAMLEVQYETLVGDLETEARRIVDFCGLDWDARCLDFHENARPVRTLSRSQVRQTLFASSIGRWRRYEPWLTPLLDAMRA